jgi:hypothetical protein
MNRETVLRATLWASVIYNALGAWALAAPGSWAGGMAAVPAGAPFLFRAELAFVVALFGALYLWLALRTRLDETVVPLVVLAAVGKAGFFAIYVATWLRGDIPAGAVVSASGDLLFALVFVWWLTTQRAGGVTSAPDSAHRQLASMAPDR